MKFLDRTSILIGEEKIEKLKKSSVLIVGVGGVGGYVCEMLARSGVGNITLLDYDSVDITNINRQIIALNSTLNIPKVEAMKNRILDINNNCNVVTMNEKLTETNAEFYIDNNFDYIIDAIDSVKDKIALIKIAYEKQLQIISALGAGNRIGIPVYEVMDISKTCNDGLARVVRKKLRELGIKKHLVVTTKEQGIKTQSKIIGSIVYQPAMCGCVLGAYVINKLIGE